ncbi:MAG: pseudouridine synthase [Chloroflexota bacterium]
MVRERLQKALAARGVASRRGAEQLIASGLVRVNGEVAHIGQSVEASDSIEVEGRPIPHLEQRLYLALNKPPGFVSSLRSTHGERTVLELVTVRERVYPVGRLDKESSGLLLLTNDGDWANVVTHPRYMVEKSYEVLSRGVPSQDGLSRLRHGVLLPDGVITAPATVEQTGLVRGNALLSVTVIEGKKREIRLMLAAIGNPALQLCRIRIGNIRLEETPSGLWRHLRPQEIESIRAHAKRSNQRVRPSIPHHH